METESGAPEQSGEVGETETNQTNESTQTKEQQTQGKSQAKQTPRKFKLKINGSQRQVDEKTALAMLQKQLSADEKFQKASALTKKAQKFFELAKADPDRVIKQLLGKDAVEFSKERLVRELEQLKLDPKDKELRDARKKIEEYENEKKRAAEQRQTKAQEQAVNHWTKHYDKVLPEAIKAAGLPLTEDVIKIATDIMITNLEEGMDLPMQAVMQFAKQRYLGNLKKFFLGVDASKLSQLLGDDVIAKIGVAPKKKPAAVKRAVQEDSKQAPSTKSQYERMKEFEQRLKRWQSGE